MKRIRLIFTTAALSATIAGLGQNTTNISQEEILKKINTRNLEIRISEKNTESARADYRQSNALFLPSISASHTAMGTTNPLMAFGSKLNQAQLTAADFNPALLNNPTQTNNYATKLSLLQPIINLDGIYERQAAKAKMEAYSLQSERTKEYLQLEGNKAYMQLQLAYKALEVLKKAEETGQENLKIVKQYYKQGILQKTDLLAVEVRATEISNQLQYAKSNVQNASDYIAFLIDEHQNDLLYKPTTELDSTIIIQSFGLSISENRKDILAMHKSSEAYLNMLRSSKMKFLPRLNAFGSYELYDTKLMNMGASGYIIGAQLTWDIFDGYKSIGKLGKAKVEYQKANVETEQYNEKSKLEWNKTKRQLRDAENKVLLSALALNQSNEAYRIRQNRFSQGLEKTSDLLMAESQMLQKQMEHLQAIFEYNYTQKYLQFLTK